MARKATENSKSRFARYIEQLTSVIGHADRAAPLRDYCVGLVAAEGRKSVEPMAAVTAPAGVSAQYQKLLHFVAESPWSDRRMLAKVREMVVPAIERHGPIEVWIIDDTSFPKQGSHSVGVHHQYCGELGKQANCQVAVTLDRQSSCQLADRLSVISAGEMGRRRGPPQEDAYSARDRVQDQAADRARTNPRGFGSGCATWCCPDGRELRLEPRAARRRQRGGAQLCGCHRVDRQSA